MTELTGFPELTPYGGGWCGNDVFATALTERHRQQAREYTQRMGERLREEGYRGYFELDFLADIDSGELYLGELNPRVTGASSMTNVTAVAYGDMPLFLFHLLEFTDVDYEIDVDALNDALGASGRGRRVEPVHPQADRRGRRADHARAAFGHLAARPERARRHPLRPPRDGLARRRRRGRGVLPAHRRRGRLPLPGRRSRHPRHARAAADGRPRAHRARAGLDRRHQGAVPGRARPGRRPSCPPPEPFSFKML